MRILFTFQFHLPLKLGGAEVSGDALASAASEASETLRLAPDWNGTTPSDPSKGLKTFRVDGNPRSLPANLKASWHALHKLRDEIRRERPDWIVANSLPAGVWSVAAARTVRARPRVAVILRDYSWWCPTHVCRLTHGSPHADCGTARFLRTCSGETMDLYSSSRKGWSYRLGLAARWAYSRLTAFAGRRADLVLSNSRDLSEVWHNREGTRSRPLGGAIAETAKPTAEQSLLRGNEFVAVLMSRLSPGKGGRLYVEAARLLLDRDPSWKFISYGVAGDVNDDSGAVERRDPVPHDEALEVIRRADVVVVPSIYPEALNRTAIEAQLVGTPVVALAAHGVKEAVAPTGGVTFQRPVAEELATALQLARAAAEAKRFDLAAAARWVRTHHSAERAASRLLEALDQRQYR